MKIRQYLINEVKVKGGYNPDLLVIDYKTSKKLGVEKDVEQIYKLTTPLPMKERMENIDQWKKSDSKLVLSTEISDVKYKKIVEKIIVRIHGKP